ncbi:FAD/NAD(P)-binding domain-containing protein [Hypoxylon crocopeplum]|nr:FAD/NAD(P)-binding domain-containing protein [Hypoxylon crocopeplum]
MTKTVVILGAGLAGLPIAHYLIKSTAAQVPDLRVVLVSPNTHFYWALASVRFVLPEDKHAIREAKYLFPIADQFAKYPHRDRFQFVAGAATALHPERNSVTVTLNDDGKGEEVVIEYHTLIVATGTSYRDGMPWKAVGTTEQTRASIAQLRAQIDAAQSIVVAGAGATGTEFAGELGAAYAKRGAKKITLLTTDALPLEPHLKESVRATAKKELEKLNVEFIGGARVVSVSPKSQQQQGKKAIEIELLNSNDGKKATTTTKNTIAADLFIPTYGVTYNTSFAPLSMISATSPGRLLQDTDLRAPGHANIFVIGDAGSLQPPQAIYADAQARHLMGQFSSYFASGSVSHYAPSSRDAKTGEEKVQYGVTIGPDRGTGQMGGLQLPSLVIWWFKGRHIGTNYAAEYAAGIRSGSGAYPN